MKQLNQYFGLVYSFKDVSTANEVITVRLESPHSHWFLANVGDYTCIWQQHLLKSTLTYSSWR